MSLVLILILCCCPIFSQDSIVLENSISEKKNISFQEHFFDAITQKAINNHQKAINSLEECNSIIPNNVSILFELSKNYFRLNRTPEALLYINQALEVEPENLWMLEHLVAIHKRDRNYEDAIEIQKKIAENYPKKKQQIAFLHLKNRDNKSALKVIDELADAKMLTPTLRRIREKLTKPKKVNVSASVKNPTTANTSGSSLKNEFLKDKSYDSLEKLLLKMDAENNPELLDFSNQGMALFPAQPLVYLMNGKAYNQQKNHKRALQSLIDGFDFVIDDNDLEKQFYKEMIVAYKAMGDTKNVTKYQKKL